MQGDCLELMKQIPDGSIDLVLTDPPYGTTACKWDNVIDFSLMWAELKRIIKPNGAICLFGSEPFSSALRMSNLKWFKYDWVWCKDRPTNPLLSKKRPMNYVEIISVFYKKQPNYNPQMSLRPKENLRNNTKTIGKKHTTETIGETKIIGGDSSKKLKYPSNFLKFSRVQKGQHPTQKPVALLEYLIKTYTLKGETVLDFTMGSGSTGVACKNLNRSFIGIELDDKYFEIAKKRIETHLVQPKLFDE